MSIKAIFYGIIVRSLSSSMNFIQGARLFQCRYNMFIRTSNGKYCLVRVYQVYQQNFYRKKIIILIMYKKNLNKMVAQFFSKNKSISLNFRFEQVEHYHIDLNLAEQIQIQESQFLNTNQVALFQILKNKENNQKFLIVTTHLLCSPYKNLIKLAQLIIIKKTIELIKNQYQGINIIFGGDFNFIPNSGLYNFMTQKTLNIQNIITHYQLSNQQYAEKLTSEKNSNRYHFQQISRIYKIQQTDQQNNEQVNQFINFLNNIQPIIFEKNIIFDLVQDSNDLTINQEFFALNVFIIIKFDLNFKSAYAEVYQKSSQNQLSFVENFKHKKGMTYEYSLSHFTQESYSYVDYIFYQSQRYEPIQIFQTISYDKLLELPFYPNEFYPSDHISLICDFQYKQ